MHNGTRKYLVFTSAGESANLQQWVSGGERCFDLCVVNYSDISGLHQQHADIYMESAGSKFGNLLSLYQQRPELLDRYKSVWVADDDILISTESINQLFYIHRDKQLTLLQPAFSSRGKISHPITRKRLLTNIRYTNFVEMTCPVVERDFLMRFLQVYDPVLVGFGIDWWMLNLLRPTESVAISDKIYCVNPWDIYKKGGVREIARLQSNEMRIKIWQSIKEKYHLQQFEKQVICDERRSLVDLLITLPGYVFDFLIGQAHKLLIRPA